MSTPVTTSVTVRGMTCGHCVSAVTAELTALAGVSHVAVDLAAGGDSPVRITSAATSTRRRARRRRGGRLHRRRLTAAGAARRTARPRPRTHRTSDKRHHMSTRTNAADTPTDQPGQARARHAPGRPRHHRHDLRVVLGPDRAQAQQARRGAGQRQPRHPPRLGALRRRRCSRRTWSPRWSRPATARRSWAATPRAPAPGRTRATTCSRTGPCASARWSRWRSPCPCC